MLNPDLGRDLARLFDEGADEVTLDEVYQGMQSTLGLPDRQKRPLLIAAAAFTTVILAGIVSALLIQPSQLSPSTVPAATTPTTSPDATPSTSAGDGSSTTSSVSSTTTPFASESWDLLPEHPVVGRTLSAVVWTGSEVIVWGGEKPSEGAWHADGAAWNPDTGAWRNLAESPLSPRSEHAAVWTGSEALICCGRIEGAGADAAAYDPASDTWRVIASPPTSPAFAEAVWSGEEMIVFGGVGGGGTIRLTTAAAYDPDTDSWRELAEMPYAIERLADSVFADGVIYVWPSPLTYDDNQAKPLAYHIDNDQWTALPAPPAEAPTTASVVWTGDQLFAYGASEDERGAFGVGLLFDPDTGSWTLVEPAPLEPTDDYEGIDGSEAALWGDGKIYIWTGPLGTDLNKAYTNVLAYEPSAKTWQVLDPAPTTPQGMWTEPIIWTGTQLITYTDPMAIYTP